VKLLLSAVAVLVVLLSGPEAQAARARIADLNITQVGEEFTISARCTDAFTKYVNNAMLSGIPIVIQVRLNIEERKKGWSNRSVLSDEFNHTVIYNNITNQYTVEVIRGKKEQTFLETDFREVRQLASTFHRTVSIPPETFDPEAEYRVQLRAVLDSQKVPPALEYILFFLRNPIDTPWASRLFQPVFRRLDQGGGE
jgi:hypothetical protein